MISEIKLRATCIVAKPQCTVWGLMYLYTTIIRGIRKLDSESKQDKFCSDESQLQESD